MSRTNQSQKNVTSTSVPLGRNEPGEASLKLLQFKHLIDLYQRQVLLPTFLAAASQPATSNTLDMRLLLENAAQQKMLLINAAAAAAAAGAVAAAATETATATATPMTNAVTPPCAAFVAAVECPGIGSAARRTRTRDQDIPTGYLKFRFNEDCGFERCGYRNHQSHFHCNRRDCHYSFCDKTRFVQHTARHERMDTLMGDDFRQYRANMRCAVVDCCYATPTAGVYATNYKNVYVFHSFSISRSGHADPGCWHGHGAQEVVTLPLPQVRLRLHRLQQGGGSPTSTHALGLRALCRLS